MSTTHPNNASPRSLVRPAPILAAAALLLLAPCLFAQTPAASTQSAVEQSAASRSDAGAPWVKERFGRPTPNVLHWSVEPAVTKAFEPSGVFEQVIQCGEFTALSNYGLYWSGEGDADDSKDMQASVVILKGQQRVFVARGYQFDKFGYDAAKKALNFRYWTGVQGDGQIVEFTLDFASGTLQPKARTLSTKGDPEPSTVQKGGAAKAASTKFYTLNFESGNVLKLRDGLRKAFPNDNFVVSESVERLALPGFDLRNVRLAEIGRTIEFLSDGQLLVEVAENAGSGNIWRIGRMNPAEAAAAIKMRSVAAPNLFGNEKALADIKKAAQELQYAQRGMAEVRGGRSRAMGAGIEPLPSQSIFAIIGDEDGVAGLESLIQVAEQAQAKAVADLHREAPKMKAVAAPHLFALQERVDRFLEEYRVMTAVHQKVIEYRWETAGFGGGGSDAYQANIHPRPEANLFMLVGHPDAIAGLESLIQAAEQLAAADDAILETRLTPEQRVEEVQVRMRDRSAAWDKEKARLETKEKADAELKANEKPVKEGKRE